MFERDVLRPDPLVGAVGHDGGERPVEGATQLRVALAQADADAGPEDRIARRQVAGEAAAGASLGLGDEAGQFQLVAEDEVDPAGAQVEDRVGEAVERAEIGLRRALLEIGLRRRTGGDADPAAGEAGGGEIGAGSSRRTRAATGIR